MEKVEADEMEEIAFMPEGPAKHARMMRIVERVNKSGEWAKYVSPAGALGLPGKLDLERRKYGIPDSVFSVEAVYDRIFIYQLPRVFGDLIEGTSLVKPESVRKREEESTPRGVIVSAGLKALDNLRSNGMDLGHVVNFIRLSPWKLTLQEICGMEINVLILRDGDIIASEELPKLRSMGVVSTVRADTPAGIEHRLKCEGETLRPMSPWIPDDM